MRPTPPGQPEEPQREPQDSTTRNGCRFETRTGRKCTENHVLQEPAGQVDASGRAGRDAMTCMDRSGRGIPGNSRLLPGCRGAAEPHLEVSVTPIGRDPITHPGVTPGSHLPLTNTQCQTLTCTGLTPASFTTPALT